MEVSALNTSAFTVPTEAPESDGTLAWQATTLVLVEVEGGGHRGLGYSYTDVSATALIRSLLAPEVVGRDLSSPPACREAMQRALRNAGRPGLGACAISAVDIALWDLKARVLELPLHSLLGPLRSGVDAYFSGGFTSQSIEELERQFAGYRDAGFTRFKMKVGREPLEDRRRVRAARQAIGTDAELYVDANGALSRKQALALAEAFASDGVTWFEEPVSSEDVEGLRLLRDRAPAGLEIAAGEYGYDLGHFRRLLQAGAVDVLQADATRCAGITGFLEADALCNAFEIPLSSHTAPVAHLPDLGHPRRILHEDHLGTLLDAGCCGMAGSFGFESGKYDVSVACGERALFPAVRAAPTDTLLLADGFSCREQLRQGTGRKAVHLAQALSHALRGLPPGENDS